ncbi:MAG: hypothetical protein R2778_12935 [Saprospiraceae bacterium]
MSTNLPNITAENADMKKNNIIIQSGNNPMQYEVIGRTRLNLSLVYGYQQHSIRIAIQKESPQQPHSQNKIR